MFLKPGLKVEMGEICRVGFRNCSFFKIFNYNLSFMIKTTFLSRLIYTGRITVTTGLIHGF